jgi:hypothetical protein
VDAQLLQEKTLTHGIALTPIVRMGGADSRVE